MKRILELMSSVVEAHATASVPQEKRKKIEHPPPQLNPPASKIVVHEIEVILKNKSFPLVIHAQLLFLLSCHPLFQ